MSRHHSRLDRKRWALTRLRVFERAGWRCERCGRAGRLECDHKVSLEHGGAEYDLENLQALCAFPCHAEKTRRENERDDPARSRWRELVRELA